jgi:hypothetical protein
MEQRNVILWSHGGSRGSAFITSSPTAIFTRHHRHLWWWCPAWLCVCTRAPMMQWLLNRKASCVLHRRKPSPISHVLVAGSKWQRQPSLYCLVTMVRSWLGSNSIEQGRRHLRASSREERETGGRQIRERRYEMDAFVAKLASGDKWSGTKN